MKFEFLTTFLEGGTRAVNLSPSAVETKGKVLSSRGFVCSLLALIVSSTKDKQAGKKIHSMISNVQLYVSETQKNTLRCQAWTIREIIRNKFYFKN